MRTLGPHAAATGRRVLAALALLALLALVTLAGLQRASSPSGAAPAALQPLYDACMNSMLQSTCRVTQDRSAPPGEVAQIVFVAGVGPVDAQAYRALRASGDAMCSLMRDACTADWDGAQCKTARSLWSAAQAPAGG